MDPGSGDTWSDIQAFKSRQNSLREKLQRRKKEREGLVLGLSDPNVVTVSSDGRGPVSPPITSGLKNEDPIQIDRGLLETAELCLLQSLCDAALKLPIDSRSLLLSVKKNEKLEMITHLMIENLLEKFALQGLITLVKDSLTAEGTFCIIVSSADHAKLISFANDVGAGKPEEKDNEGSSSETELKGTKRSNEDLLSAQDSNFKASRVDTSEDEVNLESLLSLPSTREKANKKMGEEILELLSKPTAKEKSLVERFRSVGGGQVQEFCPHGTKDECVRMSGETGACDKLHFKKIIQKHTDESLGDCSFLNTCFHMDTCKYVHYEVDYSTVRNKKEKKEVEIKEVINVDDGKNFKSILNPSQWIQCDLRFFDMSILGKFTVVMADPPWDIHMELPYGTMSDDEMRKLNIPSLQDEGLIFLWVTGRAMELGRECLKLWGYERCDEIIWVKTNQLQRIIRTGRTGHWLNHGKEHCLVGLKGQPDNINRGLDCDVIVAEVRATSHKPDEIYGIIERLSPGTKKIELFGRPHNIQPNWVCLGNQLHGVRLIDPELIGSFKTKYPDGNCMKKPDGLKI